MTKIDVKRFKFLIKISHPINDSETYCLGDLKHDKKCGKSYKK